MPSATINMPHIINVGKVLKGSLYFMVLKSILPFTLQHHFISCTGFHTHLLKSPNESWGFLKNTPLKTYAG
jgi:hypothetical protein